MYYIYFCNLYKAKALPLSTWGICDLVFRCVSLGADAKIESMSEEVEESVCSETSTCP